ncbi:hypothetical protein C8J57DRAFT_1458365 [Mycena rebaudengoi]|nr:hypothetical protein C8J57DRAFT_1458365 [Mycena rebaudengoi]
MSSKMASLKLSITRKRTQAKELFKHSAKTPSAPQPLRPLVLVEKVCPGLPVVKQRPAPKPAVKKEAKTTPIFRIFKLKQKPTPAPVNIPSKRMIPRPNSEVLRPPFVVSKRCTPPQGLPTVKPAAHAGSAPRLLPLPPAISNLTLPTLKTDVKQDPSKSPLRLRPLRLAPPGLRTPSSTHVVPRGSVGSTPAKMGVAKAPLRRSHVSVASARQPLTLPPSPTRCCLCGAPKAASSVDGLLPTPSANELVKIPEKVDQGIQTDRPLHAEAATTTGDEPIKLETARTVDSSVQTVAKSAYVDAGTTTAGEEPAILEMTPKVDSSVQTEDQIVPAQPVYADVATTTGDGPAIPEKVDISVETEPEVAPTVRPGTARKTNRPQAQVAQKGPSVSAETVGPSAAQRTAMAGLLSGEKRVVLKNTTNQENVGAGRKSPDTGLGMGGVIGELKSRWSAATTPSFGLSNGDGHGTPSTARPVLQQRRPRAQKENVPPQQEEEPELLRFFRRRSGGHASSSPPLGSNTYATPQAGPFRRPVLRPIGNDTNINGDSTSASSDDAGDTTVDTIDSPFGKRRIGRLVVPALDTGTVASKDPRVQSEIEALRAQSKVGGAKVGNGSPGLFKGGREMSLRAFAVLSGRNKKESV